MNKANRALKYNPLSCTVFTFPFIAAAIGIYSMINEPTYWSLKNVSCMISRV